MSERVYAPQFELMGPPCEIKDCKGVLLNYISTRSKEYFRKCSECHEEFHRVPATEALAHASRTIERALKGVKNN